MSRGRSSGLIPHLRLHCVTRSVHLGKWRENGNATGRDGDVAAENGGKSLKNPAAMAVAGSDLHRLSLRGLFSAIRSGVALLDCTDSPLSCHLVF